MPPSFWAARSSLTVASPRGIVAPEISNPMLMAATRKKSKAGRPRTADVQKRITLGISGELAERVNAHIARMRAPAPGVRIDTTDALRSLLIDALDRAEARTPQAELPLKESSTTKT